MKLPKLKKEKKANEKLSKSFASESRSTLEREREVNFSSGKKVSILKKRNLIILAIIVLVGIFALLLNTRLGDTIKDKLATVGIIGETKASNLEENSGLTAISEPTTISDQIYDAGISTLASSEIHWDGDWGVSVGNVIIYGGSETDDGGLITGGMFSGTFNFGNGVSITSKGNSDGFVVKYNSDKEVEWAKSYGGSSSDWIYTMDLASDGGYVVAGDFMSSQATVGNNIYTNATAPSGATTGAYSNDGIVIKYTRNGSISWSSHISGSGLNLIDEIITTNDNGALVSLITNSSDLTVDGISVSGSSARLMIIKYDSNGNYQWSKQLGNGNFSDITSIFQNSNGEYLVTGEINNSLQLSNGQNISNQGGYDGIVIKCDSNGNINFAKAIGGNATDVINSAVYTDDGGILVGGRFYSSSISLGNGYTLQNSGGTSTSDGFVVKYDKNGNVEWSKSIGNSGADSIDMVLVRDDGKIIVGGSFNGSINLGNGITVTSKGSSDILLVQLSDEGNVELAKVIGGSSSDTVEKMRETRDGGILITGRTTSSSIDLGNGETVNGTGGILIKVSQYIEEKIDVQVTKQWNDSNNSAGKRPSALQIILKNGNQEVDRQQINSSTGWACTFSNLQKNDDNGNEINYTVTEEEINQDDLKFYSTGTVTGSIEQGFTITNTFSVPNDTVSVKVTKNWVDTSAQRDKRPSQVTVQVSGGGTTRSYNLKSSENWTYTFTGLPKYNSYGNEINYTVQETSTNQFYEQTSTTGSMSSGYTITNTFKRPTDTISLTVNKVWDDNYNQAGKRPSSVNIVVTGNGSTYRRTINSSYAGSYSNIWTVTFTGLPKYDNNGDEINYTVDEENLSSIFYTKEGVTGNISSGYTITNTFEVPDDTIQISATKVWDDNYNQAGKRPSSITLKLTGNGNTYRRTINSSSDRTTITFTGLPKYNSLGNEINYTLSEESTGSIFYTAENTDISGSMEDGFTVTNEFVVPNDTVSVKVTKSWVDTAAQQDKRPSEVTVVLKNGTSEVRSIELNSSNGWTYTFTNLPKYNNLGNEINYTVEEETTNKFYTSSVSGNMTNGYVITNTFEVPDDTVQVTVDKVWDDNRDEAEKRPDSVTLKVTGNGKSYTQEVTAANSLDDENIWSYTFTNLPKYDDNGNEIDYIVDEEDINSEFYLKSVDQAGNKITNTFQVPGENVNIRVTKVWDDNDNLAGKRPQNVTLQIKNGNSVVASEVVDSEDNWTHEFTVPKYDSLGNEINYIADEANLGNIFYTSENKEISGSMSSGFTITNSFVVPDEKVLVNVSKVWVDTGLQQDKRPSQVTVILKNGDSEVQRIELNSGSEWKGKFNDLSRYDSLGNEINYTIEEVSTNKFYTSSISGNMANGFVITNTFERPNDTVEVTVNKFWNDNNNEAGKRPENVTLKVTGNGQTYKQEVNSDNIGENNNTWTYTFTNLPKYDANGNEIAYTADEEDLGNKFYVKGTLAGSMEGGFTITNIFQVPDEKVEVPVTKIWDDSSNSAGKRPSSVTLKLTGSDGQDYTGQLSAANVESDNSNNWTYTFRNLPKYDNLGNEVEYTLSEESTGSIFYTPENAVIDQENKTITNKFIVPNDTIQVPVTKIWDDNSNNAGKRPDSVTVKLTGNGREYTRNLTATNEDSSNSNNWTYTFTNLPKYDDRGDEITYTLSEESTGSIFYTAENTNITGSTAEGYTVTNKFVVPDEKVSVKVSKTWVDTAEQEDKRSAGVTVVIKNGENEAARQELNSSNGWTYTFTNLPKYNNLGNTINYTAEEVTTNKFYTSSTTGDMTNGYVITNTFQVPNETVDITVNKVWADNNNEAEKRPDSVILKVTGDSQNYTQVVTEENSKSGDNNTWVYTFTGLPKYDGNGDEIDYTVDEENLNSEFYLKSIDQESKTVTNTFQVPGENVNIRVTKEWDDNNNEAGKRPTSITLQVKNGQSVVTSQVVNAENGWTYQFTVPKYDSLGNEIDYTADEASSGNKFYIKTETTGSMTEGFTVTNKFTVPDEKVEVPVTKAWDDNSNSAGKRPTSVTLKLTGDGKVYTQDLSAANAESGNTNNWTYTFTNLPKYNNSGDEINYTLSEDPTGSIFYTEQNAIVDQARKTITNKFVVPNDTIQVPVTKVWDDNGNNAGKRPSSITLKLIGNGQEYTQQLTVTNADSSNTNNWKYTFTNLPKYNSVGDEIVYTLTENPTGSIFYTEGNTNITGSTAEGYTVTNKFVVPNDKVSVDVSKVWSDTAEQQDKRSAGVTVVLKNGTSEVSRQELNSANSWKYTFSNLDKYDSLGNEINYTVEEETTNKFYTATISGNMTNGYVITNTFQVPNETVNVKVNKVWDDNNNEAGKRPESVTLKVTGNGEIYTQEVTAENPGENSNTWTYTFTGLDKYDANGDEIDYTVDEENLNSEFYLKSVDQTSNTVTNTFQVPGENIQIRVTKAWDDNNNEAGKRPSSVTLQIKNGESVVTSQAVTAGDNWTYTFSVPKYDSLGNVINYTADEANLGNKFYTKTGISGTMTDGFTVTNKFAVPDEKVEIPVTKVWDDDGNSAGKRPANITVKLTGDGQEYTQQLTVANVDPDNSNNWTYTFSNLPKYDRLGNEITYTLSEESTGSIFYTVQNTVVDQESKTITNTFEVPDERIQVPVTKVWDDNGNNAGKRPSSVTVKLTGNGQEYTRQLTVANADSSNSNTWTYTFTNLPKYNSIGDEINYTLSEDPTGSIFYTAENTNITGSMVAGYTVTNKFVVPNSKVTVDVSKVWDDTAAQQDKRSAGVTVVLKNGTSEVSRQELNAANSWKYTFTNLDKYDSLGNEINYTVEEETTNKFYTSSISGNMNDGYVITNTFQVPNETVDVKVNKVWADNNNEAGKRPSSVTLKVTGNGKTFTQVVTAANPGENGNTWTYTFTGLDKYDGNGDEIDYTIDEENLNSEFYLKSVDQISNTVTNTFQVPGENVNIRVTKVWDDNENEAGKRPSSVTLQIKNGQSVVTSQAVSEGDNWTYEFTVPKYDNLGNVINYTADEANSGNKFYTKTGTTGSMTDGFTVTNKFAVPDEKVEIPVTKIWDDNSNSAGKRPTSITVKLTGNGQEYTQDLSAANAESGNTNNWTCTFTNLPKYDRLGNEINYTLSEESTGSIFYTEQNTVVDQTSKTITNKFVVPDERIEVPVTKVWDDNGNNAGKRPSSVTIKLTGNGQEYTQQLTTANVDANNSNNWKYTFTNLPRYNSVGDEINYTLSEDPTGSIFYTAGNTNITGSTAEGYTVTNKFVVPNDKVTVKVSKAWVDTAEQQDKRSAGVTVVLKNGTSEAGRQELNSTNGWTYTFSNLPKYNNLGNEINYTVEEETTNKFYTSSISGDMTNGYVITNTFQVPKETVDVKVNKVWVDSDNEAGKRPDSVTLKVAGNGQTYTQVVTAGNQGENANTWTYTFTGLDKYDGNGDEIDYTVDEENLNSEFYLKSVDQESNTVTNTFQVPGENVQIRVTKAWDDNNNEAGKRPSSVTLQIKNGESVVTSQAVSEGDNWTYEFTVPKYDSLGNPINYTADEANLGNKFYTKTGTTGSMTDGFTVTNTFAVPDETVEIPVTKVWDDDGNSAGKRPANITVKLTGNGQEYTQNLTATNADPDNSDNWKYTFSDLPKYDSFGNEINYVLSEESTGSVFYTEQNTVVDQARKTITNKFVVPDERIEVPVTKVWDDSSNIAGKRPSSVTVRLTGDGQEYTQNLTVTNADPDNSNNWKYTFTNLPKYDDIGDEINYTLKEDPTGSIFYTTGNTDITGSTAEGYTVTNKFEVPDEKVSVKVSKLWDDTAAQQDKRPSGVTIVLKNGTSEVRSIELNTTNGWTYTFDNLPKYDSLGNVINYTIEEETTNKFYTSGISGNMNDGYVVTNTFQVPKETVDVKVNKVWADNNNEAGKRPDRVTLKVTGNGQTYTQEVTASNVGENANTWTYTFTGLDKYDGNGDEIDYTVDEENLNSEFYLKSVDQVSNTVTNTFQVPGENVNIRVTKVWDDNENEAGKRPQNVTLQIKNGQSVVSSEVVDAEDNWTHEFTLPKYDTLGNAINYTADEADFGNKFYTKTGTTGNMTSGFTVTNKFTVPDEKVSVDVSKVWSDTAEQQDKRSAGVTIVLKNGTSEAGRIELNDSNNWKYTFSNLDKYDSLGNEINYTVEEETTNKFYTSSISGNMNDGYVVTNTFQTPKETVDVKVNKVWEDNNNEAGKRPDSVTLKVTGNGKTYKQEVSAENIGENANTWTYTFTGLDKYDANGDEIDYIVDEDNFNSEFYLKSVDQETNTVTNTFQVPGENINIRVTKVWDDNENEAGKRPSSVTLQIKNGQSVVTSQAVNAGNNWTYEFTVPKYDALGNVINYTADEADLGNEFYTKVGTTGSMTEGFTVTNKFTVPDEKVSVDVSKVWSDTAEQQDKRSAGVTIVLKNGTSEAGRIELNDSNNWKYTFSNLDKYDSLGNEINYTVEEETTNKFYTSSISGNMTDGYVITNTFERPTDTVNVTITKTWDHTNNIYTIPDSVILQVKNGNQVIKTQTVTSANATPDNENVWSYTFTGLDKYDENGNEITYTAGEDEITPGDLNYYKASINGTNITNTYDGPVISQSKSASTERGLSYVVEGENITYTITVKNDGGVRKDVIVKDSIPEGTTFVEDSVKVNGSETDYSADDLSSGITVNVDKKSETKVTFEVTVNVLPEGIYLKELRNVANVDGNDTNESVIVVNKSNLTFEKSSDPENGSEVAAGDEITYTISLNNSGTLTVDAVVKDSIPEGTTFVSDSIKVNDADTDYDENDLTSGIRVPVGSNESLTLSFKVTVNDLSDGATIKNVATVNDVVTNEVIHQYREAEISSVKSQYTENNLDYVVPGEKIVYTIIAKNSGGLDKNVVIKDTIPEGTTFVDGSIKVNSLSSFEVNGETVDFTQKTADDLANGITLNVPKGSSTADGFVRLSFEVIVNDDSTGEIRNTGTVDGVPTNEVSKPILSTEKVSSIIRNDENSTLAENEVAPNDKIKYTIRITNTGTSTINNVEVKDIIPSGTKLVSIDNEGLQEENEITWNIASITGGETREVSFTVKVEYAKENISIKNTASVDDSDTTNEVENHYVKPTPEIETNLTKNGTDTIISKDQVVNYEIKFTASVNDFKGTAKVTIVDNLPYEIDISKSKLANGTYNSEDRTITWDEEFDVDTFETNAPKDIVITKTIEIVYIYDDIDEISGGIVNTAESKIELIEDGSDEPIYQEETEKETEKETTIEIPTEVVVHHYLYDAETDSYTTIKLAPDETIDGVIGKSYDTKPSSSVPSNYECVNTEPENYAGTMTEEPLEVTYYYSLITPVVTNTMNKTAGTTVLTAEDGEVTYDIRYTTNIDNYIGKSTISIVDKLPAEIDVEKSDLGDGIYDSENRTITWEEQIDLINTFKDGTYNYEFNKTIKVVYTGQNMAEDLSNTVAGTVNVYYPEDYSSNPGKVQVTETAEDTVTIEQDYKVDLKVEKVWDDNDNQKGHRPDGIIVTISGGDTQDTVVELNDSNNWSYELTDLDKYDDKGNLIKYSVAESEKNVGDLKYYSARLNELSTDDPTEEIYRLTNTYKLTTADLDANITKSGPEEITSSSDVANYEINFTSTVKDYIGDGKVIITDTIPYGIDESKSNLDGGTYDDEAKTITWEENLNNIDTFSNGDYAINITKNISVVFVDLNATQNSFTNTVLGKVRLYETEQEDQATASSNTLININGNVVVKYVDIDTNEEISERTELQGKVGDEYTTSRKQIDTYEFVKSTPNTEGLITEETQEVTYYYQRKAAQVVVKYQDTEGNSLTEDVIIDGKVGDSYTTEQKEFENYEFVSVTENAEGTMTEDTIIVIYVYQKIPATVIVKYLEKDTNKVIALEDEITGYIGDKYYTDRKIIKNYQSAEPEPDNKSGVMTKDVITVIYYYEKIPAGDATVKYVDIDTDEEIVYKDPDTGENRTYGYTISGFVGDNYTAEQKDIPYYNFIRSTSNSTGQLTEAGDTIIFYYQKQKFNLEISKSISEITLDGTSKGVGDGKNTKVEIHRKKIGTADLEVKYKIVVSNTGEIEGTAKVVDILPSGYIVSGNNPMYWVNSNGSLETTVELQPGETKELEVILKWVNGESNFGTSENIARITDTTTPANYDAEITQKDNEDTATLVVSVETGINRNVYLIITTYLLMIGLVVLLYLYEQYQKERKVGIAPKKTLKLKLPDNKK